MWSYTWIFDSIPLTKMSGFVPGPCSLYYMALQQDFKSGLVMLLADFQCSRILFCFVLLFYLFLYILIIQSQSLLCFLTNFKIELSISVNNWITIWGDFIEWQKNYFHSTNPTKLWAWKISAAVSFHYFLLCHNIFIVQLFLFLIRGILRILCYFKLFHFQISSLVCLSHVYKRLLTFICWFTFYITDYIYQVQISGGYRIISSSNKDTQTSSFHILSLLPPSLQEVQGRLQTLC